MATPGRWGPERTAANRWGPDPLAEPDCVDATDGRHALDRDAALTPIFTALRRGRWRRPRGQAGAAGLRLAPEPVDRADGPPTAPIPVVPALHALDRYPTGGYSATSVDPSASGGFGGPGGFRGVEPYAGGVRDVEPSALGYRWPAVAPSASDGHRAVPVDLQTWDANRGVDLRAQRASGALHRTQRRDAAVDPFDPGSFVPRVDPAAAPPSRTETTAVWFPGDYAMAPQQVTDTGRHHRRLAPAGW